MADPNMDHRCWERPEDMDTPRNAYKVTTQNPGSDVAAETAAALAAASIVLRDSDPSYSVKLLQTASEVPYFVKLIVWSLLPYGHNMQDASPFIDDAVFLFRQQVQGIIQQLAQLRGQSVLLLLFGIPCKIPHYTAR